MRPAWETFLSQGRPFLCPSISPASSSVRKPVFLHLLLYFSFLGGLTAFFLAFLLSFSSLFLPFTLPSPIMSCYIISLPTHQTPMTLDVGHRQISTPGPEKWPEMVVTLSWSMTSILV